MYDHFDNPTTWEPDDTEPPMGDTEANFCFGSDSTYGVWRNPLYLEGGTTNPDGGKWMCGHDTDVIGGPFDNHKEAIAYARGYDHAKHEGEELPP